MPLTLTNSAPCRNRTYNLVTQGESFKRGFRTFSEGARPETALRWRLKASRIAAQGATKVQHPAFGQRNYVPALRTTPDFGGAA